MLIVATLSLCAGCAAPSGRIQGLVAVGPSAPPNLLLGRFADDARSAQWLAGRADWPAIDAGYRVEDVSTTTEVSVNDESFYDRMGGGFYRTTFTTRTGAVVR